MTSRPRIVVLVLAMVIPEAVVMALRCGDPEDISFAERVVSVDLARPSSVCAADLDGDDDIDIIAASKIGDRIAWYENLGGAPPEFRAWVVAAVDANDVFAADVDDDGKVDILSVSSSGTPPVKWHRNMGGSPPTFVTHAVDEDGLSYAPRSVFAADFDADDDIDIVTTGTPHPVVWYEQYSDGDLVRHPLSAGGHGAGTVLAHDLDGDPDLEFVVAMGGSDAIVWYDNQGGFAGYVPLTLALVEGLSGVSAADIDGDGDIDVIGASGHEGFAWFENDGQVPPTFTARAIPSSHLGGGIVASDIDSDGDMDVLAAGEDRIFWLENGGGASPVFTEQLVAESIIPAISVYAADLDGDGIVGFSDLVQLLVDWGDCVACRSDLDFNGEVGYFDLTSVLAAWTP